MNLFEPPKYAKGDLVGVSSHAVAIMNYFRTQARRSGWDQEDIDKVIDKCKKSSYWVMIGIIDDHLKAED